jgi:ribonuclease P protein component
LRDHPGRVDDLAYHPSGPAHPRIVVSAARDSTLEQPAIGPQMSVPRARFRPHERLRDSSAFRAAFERKKPASDDLMIVYATRNSLQNARLGISIGKKKVPAATDRNRVKRLIREAFRLSKAELPIGVDFVVVPRGSSLSFEQALRSLPNLCRSAARRIGVVGQTPGEPGR